MKCSKYVVVLGALLCATAFLVSCSDTNEVRRPEDDDFVGKFPAYYWYKNEKISLKRLDGKKIILFKDSDEEAVVDLCKAAGLGQIVVNDVSLSPRIICRKKNSMWNNLKWALINTPISLKEKAEILYEAPFFLTEESQEVGLSFLFYVKLKKDSDISNLENIARKSKVEIIGYNEFMPLWFTIACTKFSSGNALELANYFYETGLFAESQPDLMSDDNLYEISQSTIEF